MVTCHGQALLNLGAGDVYIELALPVATMPRGVAMPPVGPPSVGLGSS